MNYISSHDDGYPYDKKRERSFESAISLLLCPGISQVYYGDETARSLDIEGTTGDATLRSLMNWEDLKNNPKTKEINLHWQKLGKFRVNHPSVGAGIHNEISNFPYIFSRVYSQGNYTDKVVVALGFPIGKKEISVGTIFENGTKIRDAYSKRTTVVIDGKVTIDTDYNIILLEKYN